MTTYSGLSSVTGRRIDDVAHIHQSISDILTTRIDSRIKRRAYGSLVPELIDHPANAANILRLKAASVMAIIRWEPRVRVNRVGFSMSMSGKAEITGDYSRTDGPSAGQSSTFTVQVR